MKYDCRVLEWLQTSYVLLLASYDCRVIGRRFNRTRMTRIKRIFTEGMGRRFVMIDYDFRGLDNGTRVIQLKIKN